MAPRTTKQPPADKPARGSGRAVANAAPKTSNAVANWEERLAAEAEAAAELEKGGGLGKSLSFKGGVMTFDGNAIKGNQIACIVVASAIEKAYYEGKYDPNNPDPPVCFALTQTDPEDLAPDPEKVAELQNDVCATCQWNEWGSADTGRGKACKDVRRLGVIPAGTMEKNGDVQLFTDPKMIDKAELAFAKLPPTALNAWAAYVRMVATTMKRPPHGVFTLLSVEPDPTNQFKITFEALELVDRELLPAVYKRHDEALPLVMQPYTYPTEEQKAERKKQAGRGGGRQPAAKAGARGKPTAGRARKY
jgi:hypothetical protein